MALKIIVLLVVVTLLVQSSYAGQNTCAPGDHIFQKYNVNPIRSDLSAIIQPSLFHNLPPYVKFRNYYSLTPPALPVPILEHMKWVNTTNCSAVTKIFGRMGFKLVPLYDNNDNMSNWFGFFNCGPTILKREENRQPLITVKHPWQKHSHVPGFNALAHKCNLVKNIERFKLKYGKSAFRFHFESYLLPEQFTEFKKVYQETKDQDGKKNQRWIYKPSKGCNSDGVKIVTRLEGLETSTEEGVVQHYLEDPYLIDGHRFELRVRTLVTSFHPLRIYVFEKPSSKVFFNHTPTLQNLYEESQNNASEWGVPIIRRNCDWSYDELVEKLKPPGHNLTKLKERIDDILIKTLLTAEKEINEEQKKLFNKYNSYQHWTMDFIFDKELNPLLLEVNSFASFGQQFAVRVNSIHNLLIETLNVVGYHFPPTLSNEMKQLLAMELKQIAPETKIVDPTFDEQFYTFNLSTIDIEKQEKFNHAVMTREQYLDTILEKLTPGDIRHLMVAEDELSRTFRFERIFPTRDTHRYLKFLESPPYFYRLQDAWETRFGKNRAKGIALLNKLSNRKWLKL